MHFQAWKIDVYSRSVDDDKITVLTLVQIHDCEPKNLPRVPKEKWHLVSVVVAENVIV